jgi:hypothetical protein
MATVAYFTFLKVLRDRSARDKLYKVVQYSLKVVLETAKRNKLESFLFPYLTRIVKRLGQARSLFRFVTVDYLLFMSSQPHWVAENESSTSHRDAKNWCIFSY